MVKISDWIGEKKGKKMKISWLNFNLHDTISFYMYINLYHKIVCQDEHLIFPFFYNHLQWSTIFHIYWSEKIEPVCIHIDIVICKNVFRILRSIFMCVVYHPRVSTLNSTMNSVYLGEPISTTEKKVNMTKSWIDLND